METPPAIIDDTRWSHFEHGADIGVCGSGATLADSYAAAATALTAVVTDPRRIEPKEAVAIACTAPDRELLLVDWLNALIFEMSTRRMLFGRFSIDTDGHVLRARAWGETVETGRHEPAVEIKGATYTMLSVAQDTASTWTARCVVDV